MGPSAGRRNKDSWTRGFGTQPPWHLSYCHWATRCIRVWRELFAPRPFSDGREMDSGYGYGYGSVGMNLRGLRGNRPRLERKVVACTAGTDTGCAVHQANALTMQLGRWLWGIGIRNRNRDRTYAVHCRRTLAAIAALLAVSKRNCRVATRLNFVRNSRFSTRQHFNIIGLYVIKAARRIVGWVARQSLFTTR